VVGDALHIPLASQSVDVVMTRSVLSLPRGQAGGCSRTLPRVDA
jgi:hypothetical protein